MKILQINSVCGVGSTGRIVTDLYKVLEEQGYKCKIAYGRGTAPENIDSIKIGYNLDNYCHVFKTRLSDKHGFGSTNATKKFIKEIEKYDPDVIHLHNIHGYYMNIEILFNYLKKSNKPVVWTLHDCWPFTGHCAYFDFANCHKWKVGCSNCKQKQEYPTSKVADNSSWNYKKKKDLFTAIKNMTIVTPSEWLANVVRDSFLGKYEVKVINNGIDLDIFKPTKSQFRENNDLKDKFIILGVASDWSERKGLKYFIELNDKLNKDYKIIVVGVNEKQKQQLPDSILSITRTNNAKELAEIYTSADVFMNPTLEDNFPTTNLESLACGTPVITFNTGGSVECIDEYVGTVTKDKSVDSLIKDINTIKDKTSHIETQICRDKAQEKYDKKIKFVDYINLYECLHTIKNNI